MCQHLKSMPANMISIHVYHINITVRQKGAANWHWILLGWDSTMSGWYRLILCWCQHYITNGGIKNAHFANILVWRNFVNVQDKWKISKCAQRMEYINVPLKIILFRQFFDFFVKEGIIPLIRKCAKYVLHFLNRKPLSARIKPKCAADFEIKSAKWI